MAVDGTGGGRGGSGQQVEVLRDITFGYNIVALKTSHGHYNNGSFHTGSHSFPSLGQTLKMTTPFEVVCS